MNKDLQKSHIVTRPPVVVVMGHVDHGKSTLLDYIRKSNIVSGEVGGITQHISAYEVIKKDENGQDRLITFLDTPGHEAFSKMRARGAEAADIAILVVSAEDGIKAQALEAHKNIVDSKIPFIVAINKIDKVNANVEKIKRELAEKGIYLEGSGGDVPFVLISAKVGTGIDDLLDMIILLADINEFTGDISLPASGIVIESKCEPQRGISATCIIKNGTLKSGMFVATSEAIVSTRILESFSGKMLPEVSFSSPIHLIGFNKIPQAGDKFQSFKTKKEAESFIKKFSNNNIIHQNRNEEEIKLNNKIIPIIIKTDVSGSIEAIEKEIEKLNTDAISFKIICKGAGAINENDLKMANINKESLILGFNTKIDNKARDLNETLKVRVELFDIIYNMIDKLVLLKEERRPHIETTEIIGSLKVLKIFAVTKNKKVIGGKVISGKVILGNNIRIIRRDFEIGLGKITELQANKFKVKEVSEGNDCGLQIETKIDIAIGDVLEIYEIKIT
jgi:translation initiation factor IF-2